MGLTKQYLRYVPAGNLNSIASPYCNTVFITLQGQEGRFICVGNCEHVYVWDMRLGEKAQVLLGEKFKVTCLAASPNKRYLAVGYEDGSVKIFDLRSAENISTFSGHSSAITTLAYDTLGHRLVSGSKDTNIIVWDVIDERGICRLNGHKGEITKVVFMRNHNIVISSSKDTFVKFWDLDIQHNFKTIIGHQSEVWSLSLVNDKFLFTGCNSNELIVWKIVFIDGKVQSFNSEDNNISDDNDMTGLKNQLRCEKVGNILRSGRGRVASINSDPSGRVIACYGLDNTVELFHVLSEEQVSSKVEKRLKKIKNKAASGEEAEQNVQEILDFKLKSQISRLQIVNASNKIKAVDLLLGRNDELRVCAVLSDNSIELYSLTITNKHNDAQMIRSLCSPGHRTDVRAVCFSSDNLAFASVSSDSIKLWNRPKLTCTSTIACGYALTVTYVPGDKYLIVGLKNGKMLIVDGTSGNILEEIQAHKKELWSVTLFPDMKGVASGGGDQTVKFWQFELVNVNDSETNNKEKVLSVLHSRTLKLEESVLCVKISPNNRFVAVALLNSSVNIFFYDTLKFFISLYGHKMPVLCMDISSDSTLIATASADHNVKIWGMDYGDCHKSMLAHDDSVTGLSFVPKTHYFFTTGKDGKIKEWDADNHQKIITLQGHFGQAWSCATSPNGQYIISCGSDRVLRLYERSSEILVLEDEAEEEREREENKALSSGTSTVQGGENQIITTVLKSGKNVELFLEGLNLFKAYNEEDSMGSSINSVPEIQSLIQAYKCNTIEEFLLKMLIRIKASKLDEVLSSIPYSTACDIFQLLPILMKNHHKIELVAKLALSLGEVHHQQIMANQKHLSLIEINDLIKKQVSSLGNCFGFTLHGLLFEQRKVEKTKN